MDDQHLDDRLDRIDTRIDRIGDQLQSMRDAIIAAIGIDGRNGKLASVIRDVAEVKDTTARHDRILIKASVAAGAIATVGAAAIHALLKVLG